MRLGLITNGGVGVVMVAVILLFPDPMIGIFLPAGELHTINTARIFLSYFWPAMLVNGINIVFSSYLTSLHKAAHSAAIALLRSLVLPAMLVISLSALMGDVGIFIAIPLAEYATLAVALLFFSGNRPGRVLAEGRGIKKLPLPEFIDKALMPDNSNSVLGGVIPFRHTHQDLLFHIRITAGKKVREAFPVGVAGA